MLYTSVPLERVYHNFREQAKPVAKDSSSEHNNEDNMEYKEVLLKHGRLVTKRDGENYVVQKVYSTDMGDYLNDRYSPGMEYKE